MTMSAKHADAALAHVPLRADRPSSLTAAAPVLAAAAVVTVTMGIAIGGPVRPVGGQ